MATPVGHVLAGATTASLFLRSEKFRKRLVLGGLLGGAADLDFIPGIVLGTPGRFHHGFTHSIAFAVLTCLVVALYRHRERLQWGLLAGSAYMSHLLLDFVTLDPSPPVGIPLLWPLLDTAFSSPIPLLPRVLHSSVSVINLHNFLVAGLEVVVFGTLLVVALKFRGGSTGPGARLQTPSTERHDP